MKQIIVTFQFCDQVGPEDWAMVYRSKTFKKTTTIEEIEKWIKSVNSNYKINDCRILEDG